MKSFKQTIYEEIESSDISEDDLQKMVDDLEWEHIQDLYDDDEFVDPEEDLEEAISAQSRLKKRMAMARTKAKRMTMRGIKLKRASSPQILQKRAKMAARRALARKFLRGRDRSKLSPVEKDQLEARLKSMRALTNVLAIRMIPKVRKLEQSRLYKPPKRK